MNTSKRLAALFVLSIIAAGLSPHAHAKETKEGPCKKIKAACEAAGFVKGGHKDGKGLYKDCLGKLKAGESVPGVTVSPEDAHACQAKMAERKTKSSSSKAL